MICNGISDEWELCTQEDFQNIDNLMYSIISNPDYKIPQFSPNGQYCIEQSHINENDLIKQKIKSFDLLGRNLKAGFSGIFFDIFNNGDVKKQIKLKY